MGRLPEEGNFDYMYHHVANPGEDGMCKWMEGGDPSEMVRLRKGSADTWSSEGIEARVKEYGEILRRMKDRRLRQYPKFEFICLAHDLSTRIDAEGDKIYKTQEDVAERMSELLRRLSRDLRS